MFKAIWNSIKALIDGTEQAATGQAIAQATGGSTANVTHIETQIIQGKDESVEVRHWQTLYLTRLQAEVSQLTSLIHIDPTAAERHMELAKVYTALLTKEGDGWGLDQARQQSPKPVSALAQLNRHDRLVLIGAPGSGKSTFVDFVVMCMAGQLLGDKQINLQLLQTPLPKEADEKAEPKPQPWGHGALWPIKIELRRFVAEGLPAVGQKVTAEVIWAYLTQQLDGLAEYVPKLRQQVEQAGGLVLFDGLDEIPEPEQRGPQLKKVIEDLAACYPKCRIVVTSRPYAYQDPKWQLHKFAQTTLANFSKGQIKQFIKSWYGYLGYFYKWDEATGQERAQQLEQTIFSRHRQMRSLAEKPLLLTLMVNLHASKGTLPNKRAELYEETVKLLLDRWERGAKQNVITPRLSDYLEVSQEAIRELLQALAFDAHATQPAKMADTANLDEARLLRGLMELAAKKVDMAELLTYLDQRAGILESIGQGIYRFPHRTFQEYLAACHLTDRDDFTADTARLVRADTNRWREVALLASAKAASGGVGMLWQLVDELCANPVAEGVALPTADMMAALLAGQAIVETANLNQLTAARKNQVNRVRGWLEQMAVNELPALERVTAGQLLGKLGDDRRGVVEMAWCDVPAGEFIMGSNDSGESNEKPQHTVNIPYSYKAALYPVTNAQYQAFVEAGGYNKQQYWTKAGWAEKLKPQWGDKQPWTGPRYQRDPFNLPNHPVIGVSWYEAVAYCCWLTEVMRERGELAQGWQIRLPTEAEWEKAARGTAGRTYPWGNEFDANKANGGATDIGSTSAVGFFPQGQSPYGCQDMAGNVWEWGATQAGKPYPYQIENEWTADYLKGKYNRILRGGSWGDETDILRCTYRLSYYPYYNFNDIGFRCFFVPIF